MDEWEKKIQEEAGERTLVDEWVKKMQEEPGERKLQFALFYDLEFLL